jgi:hypothetical protein
MATDSSIAASGSTRCSPYRWLKLCAMSRAISMCCTWSRPTGILWALNIRMSAAISTGYMKRPAVTSASGSAPAAVFLSTEALYAWARLSTPLPVTQVSSQVSSGISGMSDWR